MERMVGDDIEIEINGNGQRLIRPVLALKWFGRFGLMEIRPLRLT